MSILSLESVVRYNVAHLLDGMTYWGRSQSNWTMHAQKTRSDIAGLDWAGHSASAALSTAVQQERDAGKAAAVVSAAQQSARQEIDALLALKPKVLSDVAAATEDGFQVNDDLSVQDLMTEYDDDQIAEARQSTAEQHCADIYSAAKALYEYDAQVAESLLRHRAELLRLNVSR